MNKLNPKVDGYWVRVNGELVNLDTLSEVDRKSTLAKLADAKKAAVAAAKSSKDKAPVKPTPAAPSAE